MLRSLFCKHEYIYKLWLQDHRGWRLPSPFYKEIVFRCQKCGKHKSLFSLDLYEEFLDLQKVDVACNHENFSFTVPYVRFAGNEAYVLYQRYLRKGFDLTKCDD